MKDLRDDYIRLDEKTFSSEQKWMAVYIARKDATLEQAKGVWHMKGAIEVVLRHSTSMFPNNAPLTLKDRAHFEGVAAEIGKLGLRGLWTWSFQDKYGWYIFISTINIAFSLFYQLNHNNIHND